jgi:hypothetical protein
MNSGYKKILNFRGTTPTMTAGSRSTIDLINGVQTHGFWVTVTAQLDITVAGTSIVNGGSILAALTFFLNQNGEDIWQQDGLIAGFIMQCYSQSVVTANVRAANAGVQAATLLNERVYLYATNPYSVIPRETAFQENDPRQRFQLQPLLAANPYAQVIRAGTGTITNVQVSVEHEYVANISALPFLRPRIREQVEPVNGTNPFLPSFVKTNNRIRGLIIKQETDVAGLVGDIINSVALRGDNGDLFGPQQIPYDDLAHKQETEFGGAAYNAAGTIVKKSLVFINFQTWGRLANVLYPWRDYLNFRLEFNCQPSVTAGATNSRIRIQLLELERAQPVAGRNIVTPTLPAFLET